MIDLDMIDRKIEELETRRETSYRTCGHLALLYVCRDHLRPTTANVSTVAVSTVPHMDGSDFLRAASGKRTEDVMRVVNEHLESVRLMFPTTYDNVLRSVSAL